ncbi:hypothetical protein [Variovorax paradoxus]|uniref:hypothetical protein n=1 Tax=Variovorax paradoxus TaxID=34073 RepID=UPI001931F189|nr:hypothetical protein INQ48_18235 [Variovorax paradoxus]
MNEIVSGLYRRFKDWSQRGFSAEDVTWCEVKADVIRLLATAPPAAIPAAPSEAGKQRFRWTDGTRTLKQDVLSAVHTYADSKPENDPSDPESWESWFKAAFDLCGDRIGDIFDEHERRAALAQPAPVQPPEEQA